MYHFRRNKSELMVLTGAIYAFVAYLTAFALEILFLVDLTRRGNEILSSLASGNNNNNNNDQDALDSSQAAPQASAASQTAAAAGEPNERFALETLHAHITIACLTIAILYFVVFITSLILIVALILRSTFMLLIWMCAMATLYLPEFGLVAYVALYAWGLDTRNGQTELLFYLMRAALNLIFILRARKLYKQWNYEKNFFRLGKTPGGGGAPSSSGHFNCSPSAYDSPYFIGRSLSGLANDSLSTTINPIFSSSTLNLNRYDFVRDQFNQQQQQQQRQRPATCSSPETQNSNVYISSSSANSEATTAASSTGRRRRANELGRPLSALYARDSPSSQFKVAGDKLDAHRLSAADFRGQTKAADRTTKQFYLGDLAPGDNKLGAARQPQRLSVLSLNDDYADYELDLDYRTLGKPSPPDARRPRTDDRQQQQQQQQQAQRHLRPGAATTTGQRFQPAHFNEEEEPPYRQHNNTSRTVGATAAGLGRSYDELAYSTQSLDRRHSRDFTLTEQVVLQPLGHQLFEYLHRPGSTTNLNYR